ITADSTCGAGTLICFDRKLTFIRQRCRPRGDHTTTPATGGAPVPVETLTYAALGQRLNCSPAAARALVKRLRLPRQKANDGKALVSVDLSEINCKPMPACSPADHRPVNTLNARIDEPQAGLAEVELALNARIDALQAKLAEVEAAACYRTDFERERERLDQLMVESLRATLEAQTAKEAVARLEGQLTTLLELVELLRASQGSSGPV